MLSPFTSHCIVRSPLSQPHHTTSTFSSLSCGILTIGEDRETVYFPEQNLSTIATFKFDTVTPASSPIAACYTDLGKEGSTGAGLVAGTDSIMVTVGDQEEGRAVVEGDDGAGGLLQSVVDDVLAHLPTLTSHKPRLSVSWYSIHTTQSSGIIDMLKTASGGSTTEPGISPDLVLSHGGKGGGTRVNGLWEIQILSAADVASVVSKVRANPMSVSPLFHNVFTLTLEMVAVRDETGKNSVKLEKGSGWGGEPVRNTVTVVSLASLENVGALGREWLRSYRNTLATGTLEDLFGTRLGMLLYDGFKGVAKLCVCVVVDPGLEKAKESLATLRLGAEMVEFGERCRKVQVEELGSHPTGDDDKDLAVQNYDRNDPNVSTSSFYSTYHNDEVEPRSPQPPRPPESTHAVPATLLAALESKQSENVALQEEIRVLQATVQEMQFEREEMVTRLNVEGGGLSQKDRGRLRKAVQEVKDYEVYKDVMESTFERMKSDVVNLTKDRDRFAARCDKMEGFFRKEKSEGQHKAKKIMMLEQKVETATVEKQAANDQYNVTDGTLSALQKQHKAALREITTLKTSMVAKDEELVAAKTRISKIIVRHERGKEEAKGVKEMEERVMKMDNVPRPGGGRSPGRREFVHESLSRAQGSLNAARKIMEHA